MPDPQPFFGGTGKRRALIVGDHQTMYHTLILIGVQDWDQLFSASSTPLQVGEVYRGRIWHGQLPSWYRFASSFDVRTPLIAPVANLGFAHEDVRVITDKNPWDRPTAENIVRRPCEMSFVPLNFVQMEAMAALVYDAQPNDSLLLYCT
jgi:hypothetical protein